MMGNGWENKEANDLFQEGSSLQRKRNQTVGDTKLMVGCQFKNKENKQSGGQLVADRGGRDWLVTDCGGRNNLGKISIKLKKASNQETTSYIPQFHPWSKNISVIE